MKVLQFAWSDPRNPFLPHAHGPNAVVYSGTHDNNTTVGWWSDETDARTRAFLASYLGRTLAEIDREPHWTLMRLGLMSPAHTFIATLQDVLGLGPETRFNTPASADGNWSWRALPEQFDDPAARRLADWTRLYRRRADQQTPDEGTEVPA
jgi:4-alpha-glucanotransferase